jgi:hypothetical protein
MSRETGSRRATMPPRRSAGDGRAGPRHRRRSAHTSGQAVQREGRADTPQGRSTEKGEGKGGEGQGGPAKQ